MTQDEIIRMAQEAGLICKSRPVTAWLESTDLTPYLTRFAALVAAHEREECAKVCEEGVDTEHPIVKGHIMKNFGISAHLAAAIRARGEK